MNLVRNYTPHLKPNTRSAPPTSELRRLLAVAARDMLRDYLRKWKNKAIYSREPLSKEMSQVRGPSTRLFHDYGKFVRSLIQYKQRFLLRGRRHKSYMPWWTLLKKILYSQRWRTYWFVWASIMPS